MEEWTAHNPSHVGFQRAGSGESHDRSPIMLTSNHIVNNVAELNVNT